MIESIKEAVQTATMVKFDEFVAPGKKREKYFARMIFAYQCMFLAKISHDELSKIIHRHPSIVCRCKKNYRVEYKVNSAFRAKAKQVEEILTNSISL